MEAFVRLDGIACPLELENIDTDQLIPARFMSRPRSAGYGGFLLHDRRFAADGSRLGHRLDEDRYRQTRILVSRRNFGTGSSREAAVYALWDFGIRCVIAPSFGDIFASNAVKNGLLPALVAADEAEELLQMLLQAEKPSLTVDLEAMQILSGNRAIPFVLDPVRRLQLLNGWDDLDLTRRHGAEIAAFRVERRASAPWAFPHRSEPGKPAS